MMRCRHGRLNARAEATRFSQKAFQDFHFSMIMKLFSSQVLCVIEKEAAPRKEKAWVTYGMEAAPMQESLSP